MSQHALDMLGKYTDLQRALSDQLSYFAVPQGREREDRNGIIIKVNKKKPWLLYFSLVTRDKFHIGVDFDTKKLCHDYIDEMMAGIVNKIQEYKQEKAKERPVEIVTSNVHAAVKQALSDKDRLNHDA